MKGTARRPVIELEEGTTCHAGLQMREGMWKKESR
jgi:hypothetical protein